MSYTRSFQKLIRIPYSGTVSNGQTTLRYNGTAEEYVRVNVLVDTDISIRRPQHAAITSTP